MKRTATKKPCAAFDSVPSETKAAHFAAPPETPQTRTGVLQVAALPIGNPDDISVRALRTLREADLIIVEDSRIAQAFFNAHNIVPSALVSLRPRRAQAALEALQTALRSGHRVALMSDAGTPGIADPGQALIRAALAAGYAVTAIPGPCAALVALVVSGLPTGRFAFDGFPPRARADRATFFHEIASESRTIILYESARYLLSTLTELCRVCGDARPAALVCDATKPTETVRRGSLLEILAFCKTAKLTGECTLLVSGISTKPLP